jgi:ubiquinone/menaquinone biosynthesis C-methylase UbiE
VSEAAERARRLWSLGEYERVAERLQPAADVLVQATGVIPGMRVLDVAAGTGNVAMAAAHAGAQVTASDIAPAMVAKGRVRTEGLEVEWEEADAEDLPYEDAGFDRVLSAFGTMFAPNPEQMTAELLRVTRPGGAIAMTTWVNGGLQGACSDLLARQLPPAAAGNVVPEQWGDPEIARRHFATHGADVSIEERTLSWTFESPEAWAEFWERGAPPVVAVRGKLGEERWAQVRPQLLEVAREYGTTTDAGFLVEPGYLLIVALR